MHIPQKYVMPSHQKMIKHMAINGNRCTFGTQNIFKNRVSFNRSMKFLLKNNLVFVKTEKIDGYFQNVYELTRGGMFFWEEIIKAIK